MDLTIYKNIKFPLIFLTKLANLAYNQTINLEIKKTNSEIVKELVDEIISNVVLKLNKKVLKEDELCELKELKEDYIDSPRKEPIKDEIVESEIEIIDNINNPIKSSDELEIIKSKLDINSNKVDLNDQFLFYVLKYFFKFYYLKLIDCDILKLFEKIKDSHSKSYSLIKLHQQLLKSQCENMIKLDLYIKRVKNLDDLKLSSKSLDENIDYLKLKLELFNGINDSTFGDGFFFKLLQLENKNLMYEKEVINRLILVKKLLGSNFFKNNNIDLITLNDFLMLDYKDQNKFYFKLFKNIKLILENDIKMLLKTKKIINLLKYIYE